jgi:hypothetical protein
MNEKLIEKKLREEVIKLGGIALKFASQTYTGMPDRIILMPGGKTSFVEIKTTGKKATPIQTRNLELLCTMGFDARLIDDQRGLDSLLKDLENDL